MSKHPAGKISVTKHKPAVGISACLLGEKVRYDGGHKLNPYLKDVLGQYVEWVSVCPEVECGLPVPREAMHLTGDPQSPCLLTIKTGVDHTKKMTDWARVKLNELEPLQLCGFIFKSKSPSSGMRDIKVYDSHGMPSKKSAGLWAMHFMKHFPQIPVEDDGRLNDPGLRENFIERIFTVHRWQKFLSPNPDVKRLIQFHTKHKLQIMTHSPEGLRKLGKLVADANKTNLENTLHSYYSILIDLLKHAATIKKNVNVLYHIMGYFKKQLSPDEKQELIEVIENYHKKQVPLIVPVTLLNHYVRKYDIIYLKQQVYLNPHPMELMLRNHV